MEVSRFELWGSSGSQSVQYQRHADGRVSYAQDSSPVFDRSYTYDQMGRVTQGLTGSEARGVATANGPYKQTYAYDAFSNLTGRTGRHWSRNVPSQNASFVNNRNPQWQYDAEGNVTAQEGRQYIFDAAGRQIRVTDGTNYIEQEFDGDGLKVKRANNGWVSYYVRSTALGGAIVAELNSQGQVWKKFIYANGQLLVEQLDYGQVNWRHRSPSNNSEWVSLGTGVGRAEEYDPAGTDVGTSDPYIDPDPDGGFGDWTSGKGIPTDLTTGCSWEGMSIGCDYAFKSLYMRGYAGIERRSLVSISHRGIAGVGNPIHAWSHVGQTSHVKSRVSGEEWSEGETIHYTSFVSSPRGPHASQKPVPTGPPTPTPGQPPVDKGYGWWGECNRSADDLMRIVRRDFSKFGNYSEVVAEGLGVAWINFAAGPIIQGRNIAITVAAMSTAVPEISRTRNMSVTVTSASTTSFTFTTNPGHLFYPGTIGFSVRETTSGVDFWIKLKGHFSDAESQFGFSAGGAEFEDRAWRSFLEKVRASCGKQPRNR